MSLLHNTSFDNQYFRNPNARDTTFARDAWQERSFREHGAGPHTDHLPQKKGFEFSEPQTFADRPRSATSSTKETMTRQEFSSQQQQTSGDIDIPVGSSSSSFSHSMRHTPPLQSAPGYDAGHIPFSSSSVRETRSGFDSSSATFPQSQQSSFVDVGLPRTHATQASTHSSGYYEPQFSSSTNRDTSVRSMNQSSEFNTRSVPTQDIPSSQSQQSQQQQQQQSSSLVRRETPRMEVARPLRGEHDLLGSCEISETQEAHIVKALAPNLQAGDIRVQVDGSLLTITGERKFEHEETTPSGHRRVERRYGRCTRSLTLPANVETTGITACIDQGMLQITIPKRAIM